MMKKVICAVLFLGLLTPVSADLREVVFSVLSWEDVPEDQRKIVFPALSQSLKTVEEESKKTLRLPFSTSYTSGDYNRIRVILDYKPEQPTILFTGKVGTRDVTVNFTDPWDENLQAVLTAWIRSLFAPSEGMTLPPPRLVDRLALKGAVWSEVTGNASFSASPQGVVMKPDGTLVTLGGEEFQTWSPELDYLGSMGRTALSGNLLTVLMSRTAITPGGTVYLLPYNSQEIFVYTEGADTLQKRRIPITLQGMGELVALLPDGRLFAGSDPGGQGVILDGNQSSPVSWFRFQPTNYLRSMAAGADGLLYLLDSQTGSLKVFREDGKLMRVVFLRNRVSYQQGATLSQITPGGRILVRTNQGAELFSPDGESLWQYRLDGTAGFSSALLGSAVLDRTEAWLYLFDRTSSTLVRVWVPTAAQPLDPEDGLLAELQRKLAGDPDNSTLRWDLYQVHAKAGRKLPAYQQLEEILATDAGNREARRALRDMTFQFLSERLKKGSAGVLKTLQTFGPETARPEYAKTMAGYEKIISEYPDQPELRTARSELFKAFRTAEESLTAARPTLSLEDLRFENLYPALQQYYRIKAPGTLVLRNTLGRPLSRVKAEVFLPRYMDFPAAVPELALLAPGQEKEISLPVVLNDRVFELQEDLPVQIQVKLSYQEEGRSVQVEKVLSVTLFRRTALNWEDPQRLAAFITPNDDAVALFARKSLEGFAGLKSLPENLRRAVRLTDALGSFGIAYTPDPLSPITEVLGRPTVTDTVRFPRTTLLYQSGDCDDTTALLASLLESQGVGTAILTTPGHVFLGFDTGEPEENAWLYRLEGLEVLAKNGRVWIPVETTVLTQGFLTGWKKASELVKVHQPSGALGFYPLVEARKTYLAPGLPGLASLNPPPAARLASFSEATELGLRTGLLTTPVQSETAKMAGQTGRTAGRLWARIGILYGRFGEILEAEKSFLSGLAADPGQISCLINLGEIRLQQGRAREVPGLLEAAVRTRPDSPVINLLLARAWAQEGQPLKAAPYFEVVKKQAPALASLYPLLAGLRGTPGGTETRASDQRSLGPSLWEQP